MTMPDFQWRVIALLMSILRRHMGEHDLHWYLAAELKVTMPRQVRAMRRKATRRTLDLGPDLLMADVLRIPRVRAFGDRPATEAYVSRATQRPAFRKARADQLALFEAADRKRADKGSA